VGRTGGARQPDRTGNTAKHKRGSQSDTFENGVLSTSAAKHKPYLHEIHWKPCVVGRNSGRWDQYPRRVASGPAHRGCEWTDRRPIRDVRCGVPTVRRRRLETAQQLSGVAR